MHLSTASTANVLFQALLPRPQPLAGMRCTFAQAKIAQPKAEILVEPSCVDLIAVVFQESFQ